MKTHIPNIFLVGPMGVGKTSIGKQLGKLTDFPFIDSDQEIERRTGVTVSWIFEVETEEGFRKRETDIIDELTQHKHIILATGGGSVVKDINRQYLKQRGVVIYLKASLEVQFERTSRRKGTRPLLNLPNPREKIQELSDARSPLYEELANLEYNTDNLQPLQLAKKILRDVDSL